MGGARRKQTVGDWSVPLSVRLKGSTHTGGQSMEVIPLIYLTINPCPPVFPSIS